MRRPRLYDRFIYIIHIYDIYVWFFVSHWLFLRSAISLLFHSGCQLFGHVFGATAIQMEQEHWRAKQKVANIRGSIDSNSAHRKAYTKYGINVTDCFRDVVRLLIRGRKNGRTLIDDKMSHGTSSFAATLRWWELGDPSLCVHRFFGSSVISCGWRAAIDVLLLVRVHCCFVSEPFWP